MANNNQHRNNQSQQKEPPIKKFILGSKELEDKVAEFEYDKGQYTITDVIGENRSEVYKSRNMQEAYAKWNVYIGRKKERPSRKRDEEATSTPVSDTKSNNERVENPRTDSDRNNNANNSSNNNNNNNKNKNRNRNRNRKRGPKPQA